VLSFEQNLPVMPPDFCDFLMPGWGLRQGLKGRSLEQLGMRRNACFERGWVLGSSTGHNVDEIVGIFMSLTVVPKA